MLLIKRKNYNSLLNYKQSFSISGILKNTIEQYKIGQILYIRYFYIHKKKRKMFKIT